MKIRPVILCGGAGTRLWPNSKNHQAKQFIDFGNWTLLGKTLERTKASIYDSPIISTNKKYLKEVKQHLKKNKINKYKIVLEPAKRNTAPAILSTALIKDIPNDQPLMFFTADHLIEKMNIFNKAINKNKSNLTNQNIFIFGIKPSSLSESFIRSNSEIALLSLSMLLNMEGVLVELLNRVGREITGLNGIIGSICACAFNIFQ